MSHALVLVYPLSVTLGVLWGGAWVFLTGAVSGIGLLLLDRALPVLKSAPAKPGVGARVAETLLRSYPLIHMSVFVLALFRVAQRDFAWWELIGIIYGLALLNGACAFPAAHELIHRRSAIQRMTGTLLLLFPLYMHFRIEHVHGHHRHVATPQDPASARLGESLYAFFVRSLVGGFFSAWRIETRRLRRQGQSPWSGRNRMIVFSVTQCVALLGVGLGLGGTALGVWIGAALLSIFLLETINYLEHYGLQRCWDACSQRYEPVTAMHSWDAPQRATNAALFNLGLHAWHHKDVSLPFTQLSARSNGPRLPYGYFEMAAIALMPPLWRQLMDARAKQWRSATDPHYHLDTGFQQDTLLQGHSVVASNDALGRRVSG